MKRLWTAAKVAICGAVAVVCMWMGDIFGLGIAVLVGFYLSLSLGDR